MSHEPSLLEKLYRRRNTGYIPGSHSDGYNLLGLFDGAGFMALSMANSAKPFVRRGLHLCVDSYSVCSAGQPTAAYTVTDTLDLGIEAFNDNFLSGSFARPSRFFLDLACEKYPAVRLLRNVASQRLHVLGDGHAVDIDKFQKILAQSLNAKKVLESGISIDPVVTKYDPNLESKLITGVNTEKLFWGYNRATCTVPIAMGGLCPDPANENEFLMDPAMTGDNPLLHAKDYDGAIFFSPKAEDAHFMEVEAAVRRHLRLAGLLKYVDQEKGPELVATAETKIRANWKETARLRQNPEILFVGRPAGDKNVPPSCMNPKTIRAAAQAALENSEAIFRRTDDMSRRLIQVPSVYGLAAE